MDDVARRAARLLEESQAGHAEEVLALAEATLRESTGDLVDGPPAMHFVRVVALIMLGELHASIAATELMLVAALNQGSVGWQACALATRGSERARLGDIEITEHDAEAIVAFKIFTYEGFLDRADGVYWRTGGSVDL